MALMKMVDFWDRYKGMVLPAACSQVQHDETQRAFYAGAAMMLMTFKRIGDVDVPEEVGVAWIAALNAEINAFIGVTGITVN